MSSLSSMFGCGVVMAPPQALYRVIGDMPHLLYNRIGHIPVIDEKGMIGMVSIRDVVHVVVRDYRQEVEHLNAFIQGGGLLDDDGENL